MTDALPPYPAPDPTPSDRGRRDRPASLARRVLPAVAALGAAGGLLAALDRPDDSGVPTDVDEELAPDTTTPSGGSTTTTVPGSAGSSSRSTTTVPATPTCTGTTVIGDSASTRYGPVQVQITLDSSGELCNVDAVAYPDDDRKSQSINARAVPQLDQRAVAAGSTSFNGISGATITSNAYKKSLQSALDKA